MLHPDHGPAPLDHAPSPPTWCSRTRPTPAARRSGCPWRRSPARCCARAGAPRSTNRAPHHARLVEPGPVSTVPFGAGTTLSVGGTSAWWRLTAAAFCAAVSCDRRRHRTGVVAATAEEEVAGEQDEDAEPRRRPRPRCAGSAAASRGPGDAGSCGWPAWPRRRRQGRRRPTGSSRSWSPRRPSPGRRGRSRQRRPTTASRPAGRRTSREACRWSGWRGRCRRCRRRSWLVVPRCQGCRRGVHRPWRPTTLRRCGLRR